MRHLGVGLGARRKRRTDLILAPLPMRERGWRGLEPHVQPSDPDPRREEGRLERFEGWGVLNL